MAWSVAREGGVAYSYLSVADFEEGRTHEESTADDVCYALGQRKPGKEDRLHFVVQQVAIESFAMNLCRRMDRERHCCLIAACPAGRIMGHASISEERCLFGCLSIAHRAAHTWPTCQLQSHVHVLVTEILPICESRLPGSWRRVAT